MSSIRLFVLGSLAQRGPMHGHGLLLLAEEEHIDEWTDFAPSAVYGAIKRLTAEALIVEDRVEKQGNYPERQIYRITPEGQVALDGLRLGGLSEIVIKPDPFNLALARLDPNALDDLPEIIGRRLTELGATLHTNEVHFHEIGHFLTVAEKWSMSHQLARVRSEVEWHEELLAALPQIIADEQRIHATNAHK